MVNSKEASFAYLETLSDEQLCAACQTGNRNAEEVLAARYHRLVRSIARPYFLAGGDTEDLLQEAKRFWKRRMSGSAMRRICRTSCAT